MRYEIEYFIKNWDKKYKRNFFNSFKLFDFSFKNKISLKIFIQKILKL